MEDASPVDVGDCHCELREPRENLPLVKVRLGLARVADLGAQVPVFAVLHDNVQVPVLDKGALVADNARVPEIGKQDNLLLGLVTLRCAHLKDSCGGKSVREESERPSAFALTDLLDDKELRRVKLLKIARGINSVERCDEQLLQRSP